MISLGLILNYLFSSDEPESQELSQTSQVETTRDDESLEENNEDESVDDAETETSDQEVEDQSEAGSTDLGDSPDQSEREEADQGSENQTPDQNQGQPNHESTSEGQGGGQESDNQTAAPNPGQSESQGGSSENQGQAPAQGSQEESDEDDEYTNTVSIIVDARQNSGSIYFGDILYQTGDTALSILERFAQQRGLSVSLSNEESDESDALGPTVVEIDGHENQDDSNWQVYINGNLTVYSPSANKVAPGSRIRYYYNVNSQ